VPRQSMRYSLGFQLHESNKVVMLEGCDAGVSFAAGTIRSRRAPTP